MTRRWQSGASTAPSSASVKRASSPARAFPLLAGSPSLRAENSPDGKTKVWPLYDGEKREVMGFDEFNVHPEKESERKIIDWERTYFLTKYYCI